MPFSLLVVDDEKNIRSGLRALLELENYRVLTAASGEEALKILIRERIDLVLSDLRMPRLSGEELLKRLQISSPGLPVIVLTGHGDIETAVRIMHAGAYDFLTKPVDSERLELLVKRALQTRKIFLQNQELRDQLHRVSGDALRLGISPAMETLAQTVRQIADSKASVLITGESGTGKEVVADLIHRSSSRKDREFVKVHCAALSEGLLESELFGHEKGAFTGADARKKGRFERADQGSLFLDEIGEIPPSVQVKILRVLQEKTFERVGGEEPLRVDVRIIAATHRDLRQEIGEGRFREDLFYRLNVIRLHIPPLRERREDIPFLLKRFLREIAEENGKKIEGFSPEAVRLLSAYSWPGNIRELRNAVESAVILSPRAVIQAESLPEPLREQRESGLRLPPDQPLDQSIKIIVEETLKRHKGNKSRAARSLGISRKTLQRKIKEYGIPSSERILLQPEETKSKKNSED